MDALFLNEGGWAGVPKSWAELSARCSEVFESRRGAKAEWARAMGLPRQRVARYFGKGAVVEPTATLCLRTLHWWVGQTQSDNTIKRK
jgi:hypothetical protein